jgi:EmrB/QacA subfamily drug resistance transporter
MAPPVAADLSRPLHEDPEIHARRWILLGVMCLSLVMVVMSVSGLNVAIPNMQRELGATATELQWIIDAYAIVFAGLLLTAGALGDRFGRKGALLIGLVIFAAGSAISGLADEPVQVIIGRGVSGIGAAFVMPATLSLISAVFPPDERAKAIALWAGFAGAGGAIGPIISGALLEGFWWGSALLVNIPVVALTIAAVAMYSPRSRDDGATPLDPVGAVLSLVGLAALLFGIIEGPERGWSDSLVLAGFTVAIVALTAFVVWQARARFPMLPLGFFKDGRFTMGSTVITVAFFSMFGFFFLFTQFLQFGRGYSPLDAGLATLPFALSMVVFAPRSASWAESFGRTPVLVAGFAASAAGFAILAVVDVGTSYLVLTIALILLGSGMALTAAPSTGAIMDSVPMSKAGVGSAINDTTRELGGALGIAVLGSIATSAYRNEISLSGLGLDAESAELASESVGQAQGVVTEAGASGAEVASRAADAFGGAFNTVMFVATIIAGLCGVGVAIFGRRAEAAVTDNALSASERAVLGDNARKVAAEGLS